MNDQQNWFRELSSFIDQNIREVQFGVYAVAGLGILFALHSVRPFAKFVRPSDIPSHFLLKKMPFAGNVVRIEAGETDGVNPLIMVDHHPLISLGRRRKSAGLPLEISSVNVTNNGFMWLQSVLSNQEITFTPLKTSKDRVYSVVCNGNQNVGQHLVKIGFATVSPIDFNLEKDKYYLKYYKNLLSAEKHAEKKGLGLWFEKKETYSKMLLNKLKSILPFSL